MECGGKAKKRGAFCHAMVTAPSVIAGPREATCRFAAIRNDQR
jgi:hypothetical protein